MIFPLKMPLVTSHKFDVYNFHYFSVLDAFFPMVDSSIILQLFGSGFKISKCVGIFFCSRYLVSNFILCWSNNA